jgi:PAS domain S-box-containing protein
VPAQSRTSWSDDEAREYASILDLANDAIIVLDLDGVIRFWNRGAERLYGFTREQACGKDAHSLLRTQFPVPLPEILAAVRVQGEWRGEIKHITCEGYEVTVASRWTPRVGAGGRLIGTFEINRDLTEEKRRQEHSRNAERLATLGRLAATVAHEINNPLDVLNNTFYLLKQQPLSEIARGLVEQAQAEVKCIADITNATLRYSRSGAQPAETRLCDVLDNVIAMYSGRIRNIQVDKRYRTEGIVIANAGELRQVFANLVGNALDALPNGGRLRITVTAAGKRGFRVAIGDNGTGIPAAVRGRIFEPFFSTKASTGTGLGLWIARDIIEKHGGTIRLRSYTGPGPSGTVFQIFLPRQTREPEFESSIA